MNTSSHISVEILAEIAEDHVAGAALDAALTHVSTCSECDNLLRSLRQLIRTMQSDRGADAPRDVLLSTISIFSPSQSPLRRVVAILTFDSRNTRPAYGMRSLHATSRQMLYSAQETDLDLRVTVQNDECILAGQIMRDGCPGGGVVKISGADGSAEASLNELCEFTLPAVPIGKYSLTVTMLDVEIEIPELELKD
jgi:hypothetical protein